MVMAFTERSAATRNAILAAARKLLSEQGYEATTIRAVAAEVGVDPSMVMRYYGNKAGLFGAAVDVDLYLEKAPAAARDQLGDALARHFVSRWEGELSDEATTLLLRSAATNADAAELLRTIFDTQITKFVRGVTEGGVDAAHRAGLVSSQLLGLAFTRYVVALPPVAEMDVDTLVESVAPVLQYYLTGELGAPVKRGASRKLSPSHRTR
jgi:AcrR family transcriptional regulator